MPSTQDLLLVWVEDEQQYIQGIMKALTKEFNAITNAEQVKHGREVLIDIKMVRSCTGVLDGMKDFMQNASVIILDLWLPSAISDEKSKVPKNLELHSSNTARGIWLCEQVLEGVSKCGRDIPILVMSGNLDTDTIAALERIGILKEQRWKKPVEFDAFVEKIVSLVKKDVSAGGRNVDR